MKSAKSIVLENFRRLRDAGKLLRNSWEEIQAKVDRASPEELAATVKYFRGKKA